jgi:carbonic anhydrase
MNLPKQNFDAYAFSSQPGYHEPTVRKEFAKAVPLRTVVIYCYEGTRSPRPRRSSRSSSQAAER